MTLPQLKVRLSFLFQKAHGVWPTHYGLDRDEIHLHRHWFSNDNTYQLSTNITVKSISQDSLVDISIAPSNPSILEAETQMRSIATMAQKTDHQNILLMISLSLAIFLVSLDTVVITTALPTIAKQFNLTDSEYAWIGSAYLLTNAAFVPFWGRISDVFGRKPTLLVANAFFMAGSIISALSPNSGALIAGRSIQGFGGGGITAAVYIVISDVFEMRTRGLMYGIIGAVWAISSSMGPLVGAGYTQNIHWRYIFWQNLPIETISVLLVLFCLHVHNPRASLWTGIKSIDWFGAGAIAGATIMFLVGLQFGGVTYPWASAPVICLLVLGVFLFCVFVYSQFKLSPFPILPFRIFSHRSTLSALAVTFFDAFVFNSVAYFLPIYYQTVLETSPIRSGVLMLPMALPLSAISVSAGWIMERTGRYVELLRGGLLLMTLAIGLLITLPSYLNLAMLVPFLILLGIGFGPNFHAPLLALQAKLQPEDVAAGTATFGFVRMLSGALGIVICQVVYQSTVKLMIRNDPYWEANIPVFNIKPLLTGSTVSAADISNMDDHSHQVLQKLLTMAISRVWILLCCVSFLGLVVSMGVERKRLDKEGPDQSEEIRV